MLAFATPEVPRSTFGSPGRQERTIELPEDAEDRVEIRNGSDFKLTAVPATPGAWEIATKTGSGLGGGFAAGAADRADARTWRFEWTKNAKTQSTQVEGLKDAILGFHGRDGRPIRVLLRGVELHSDQPLVVWKDQKILFEKLDSRTESVEWGGSPEVLEGTPLEAADPPLEGRRLAAAADPTGHRCTQAGHRARRGRGRQGPGAEPPLERDLIPGEVKLKLAIDPARPGSIDVRIEPDREKILEGRAAVPRRESEELKEDTPKDKNGDERDPLEYRRARLGKLREDAAKNHGEIQDLEREIAELERINEIRRIEDLLAAAGATGAERGDRAGCRGTGHPGDRQDRGICGRSVI